MLRIVRTTEGAAIPRDSVGIRRLELAGERRDVFRDMPDMGKMFYGVADYLSLWTHRHGFGIPDIQFGGISWRTSTMLTFRVTHKGRGDAISPCHYDARLPEHPLSLAYRPKRIRAFLATAHQFRHIMCRVEDHVRDWASDWEVNLSTLEVSARWARSGHVVLKLIPPAGTMDPRRYMTHYRHEA